LQTRVYRFGNSLVRSGQVRLARLLALAMRVITGAHVPASAEIGRGTIFAYGAAGLVLHDRVVVGENCLLSPGVVVGGRSGHWEVPIIEDNVSLYPGAKVLGPVTIGRGSVVGANAVVVSSLSPNSVVVSQHPRVLDSGANEADSR
jgi:serine O-acetyltransferase